MVEKGRVSALKSGKATVVPQGADRVTAPLCVPQRLWERLEPQTWVAYSEFEDGTGIVLEIMND